MSFLNVRNEPSAALGRRASRETLEAFGGTERRRPVGPASVLTAPYSFGALRSRADMFLLRSLLQQVVRRGSLTVFGPDGRSFIVGTGAPSVAIRISDPAVISQLAVNPDVALGEAYMDGSLTVENGEIYGFLDLCLSNLGCGSGPAIRRLRAALGRVVRRVVQHNPIPVARSNVAHHYDLSDALYGLFLDLARQYSCAYFASPDDDLEKAQQRKLQHLSAKLLLRPGQKVLDIGSGWGGLALHLANTAGVHVTGLTLSKEQCAYAQRAAVKAGCGVEFLLKDYREQYGRYDRIVSVGMFEHVGVGHYREYFAKVRDLLSDDGVALVHTIGRADGPGAANAWINKYIFPGGYVPALSEILPAVEKAGLYVTDIEVLRLHYAETLKAWRQRFNANRHLLDHTYDERFCRMWEFYLAGCEAAFRHGGLVNFQIQLAKRVDAVPLTRDYVFEQERRNADLNASVPIRQAAAC